MGHRKIPCSYGVPSNVLRAVSSSLMRCLCGLAFRRKISASSVMVKFFRIQLRAWSLVVLSSPPPTCLTVLVQQRGRSVAAADGEGRAIFEESEVSLFQTYSWEALSRVCRCRGKSRHSRTKGSTDIAVHDVHAVEAAPEAGTRG
eukprot:Polyplicarium_translucidae@DN810_c0_g1_i2.p1